MKNITTRNNEKSATAENESGFTQIPNELLEALAKTKLSAYESKYIFALLRKTFGYHKEKDYIANSQFAKMTGIKRPHICRTEVMLLGRKIIACAGNKIGINASFDQWRELPTGVIITRRGKTVAYVGNKKLPVAGATKEIKENIQKKEIVFKLKDWNGRQSSPIPNFTPENIVNKHGVEKIEKLFSQHGPQNGGFSKFLKDIKNLSE